MDHCRVESWVDRYGDALFRYAIAKTGEQSLAEDLVQETFVAAVTGQKQFRNESTVSTWLFAILRRKIADHFRTTSRQESRQEQQEKNALNAATERSWKDDPATICEDKEFRATLDACVEKLPNRLAEVFILREVNHQTPKEICEILGLSATNLSMRLHRCRLAIRDCLNVNWFGEES
ncbi:RNA polymerase sigma-70 factor (ECF subfamily) [Rhodopirellula rubra]|uniref:RNA polymerase sigma-70 factor (ECF subfamily) n=1 Tax=Aporhodopirellula rubra TaxID=980271 RepID=A0A7W5DZB6_9BACT|nr:sigma-70 family RNA polymerase sigma factor [Aporhodopirellula rubra]MBB3207215.1 RNA polymerase sigma-70 factor (ECF subfamily) [Aporhodopirellula rubra]